jgi:hypothetical protein
LASEKAKKQAKIPELLAVEKFPRASNKQKSNKIAQDA